MFARTRAATLCLLLTGLFGCEHALHEGEDEVPAWALDDEAQGVMRLREVKLAPMQAQVTLHNASAHPAGATLVVRLPELGMSVRREVVLRPDELREVSLMPALSEGALESSAFERVLVELTLLEDGRARAYHSTWWQAPAPRVTRGATTP